MAREGGPDDFEAALALSIIAKRHPEMEAASDGMCRLIDAIFGGDGCIEDNDIVSLLDELYHAATNTAGCCHVDDVVR